MSNGDDKKPAGRREMVVMTESLPANTVITPAGLLAIHRQFHAQDKRLLTEAHALHILAEFNPQPPTPDE